VASGEWNEENWSVVSTQPSVVIVDSQHYTAKHNSLRTDHIENVIPNGVRNLSFHLENTCRPEERQSAVAHSAKADATKDLNRLLIMDY
jgi:hypothetical protein